jgi:hypothetical protein
MLTALGAAPWARAAEEAPDALIQRLSTEVLQTSCATTRR